MQLMSDGLDVEYRLPQTREAVEKLRLAPWRARQIAQLTHRLSADAAAYVDAKVAPIADTAGRARIERLVEDAAARFDAELLRHSADRLADVTQIHVAPVRSLEHIRDHVPPGPVRRDPQLAPVGLPGLDLSLLGQLQHDPIGHAVHDDWRSRALHLDQHLATTLDVTTDSDPGLGSLVHMGVHRPGAASRRSVRSTSSSPDWGAWPQSWWQSSSQPWSPTWCSCACGEWTTSSP